MTQTIILAPTLDLKAAAPLHNAIMSCRGEALVMDGSQVERLGGQCLQILLAAQAFWTLQGDSFALRNVSPAFAAALALLGATPPAFNLSEESAA